MTRKNILIEQITGKELAKLEVVDLRHLRSRFINIFDKYFLGTDIQKAAGMMRKDFMMRYMLLRKEMDNRGVDFFKRLPIDQELGGRVFKSLMWGLDIAMLSDMLVIPDYISISGEFIRSPKKAAEIEVVIKNKEENRSAKFEAVIAQLIKDQTRKEPVFVYRPKGPESSYIPVFDLILKARDEIEKVQMAEEKEPEKKDKKKETLTIEKPEVTENTIRIPVGGDCEVTATIKIDEAQGISALYCGRDKKIRTFIFDKRKRAWTMASAKAWVKEQKEKVEKKLSETQRADYEAETAKIRESRKKATYPHKFKAAKWTHPNGHPRCVMCGQEQRESEMCSEPIAKFRIVKIVKAQQKVGGIVYEPDEIDTQGDYTDEAEIEKAMHRFMEKYATDTKRIRINHEGKRYFFPVLESFQPEEDTIKGDKPLKKGSWWLMLKVTNKAIWDKIERGELAGFSMGGTSRA